MAKRRKLEAPSAEDLTRIEAELGQAAHPRGPLSAPIAQVAADSAAAHDPRPAAERAEQARDKADAEAMREAQGRGLVMVEIGIDEIDADAMVRDRVVLDAAALDELKGSIAANGLRLPIEVYELAAPTNTARYGLLSGYRRLKAVRDLKAETGQGGYDRIRAVVRDPAALGGAFAAMVEENEIRADVSPFERGRIAVLSAQQGVFASTEDAVDALFPMASKAKRSKIRSFAQVFEELGDMLTFPDLIRERDGLRLAAALRAGAGNKLRVGLAARVPETPAEEAELLNKILAGIEPKAEPKDRGGRPRKDAGAATPPSAAVGLSCEQDTKGWAIRVTGDAVDAETVEALASQLRQWLKAG